MLNAGTGAHWIGIDASDGSIYFNERGAAADVRIFRPGDGTFAVSTNGSERVRVDSNGAVGIGTDDPRLEGNGSPQPLDVAGAGPLGLAVGPTTDDVGWMNIYGGTPGSNWHMSKRTAAEDDRFGFHFYDGTSYQGEFVTVTPDGNVGIGNTAPSSALQVNGYTQLDVTSGAPPVADCDEATEYGRMKVDAAAGVSLLYICTADGWVGK